jgi:hypothetical protein
MYSVKICTNACYLEFIILNQGDVEVQGFDFIFDCLEPTEFFFRELEFHSGTEVKENV